MRTKKLSLLVVLFGSPALWGCLESSSIVTPSASPPLVSTRPTENETRNQIQETNFDDLKFEMELDDPFQRSLLTPKIEQRFNQRIRIRGYIYPTLKKKGLKQFVLVRDNLECCFGPGAALYDCILVHMQEGKTAEFSIRPVAVEGTFSFEEFRDEYDGTTRAIYRLDGESVSN